MPPPPNRVLYDVLCVGLGAANILSRAVVIQTSQALGQRIPKRDWYGNEIGPNVPAEWVRHSPPQDLPRKTEYETQLEGTSRERNETVVSSPPTSGSRRNSVQTVDEMSQRTAPTAKDSTYSSMVATPLLESSQQANGLDVLPLPSLLHSNAPATHPPPIKATEYGSATSHVLNPLPELSPEDQDSVSLFYTCSLVYIQLTSVLPHVQTPLVLKASKVPSTTLGRFLHYGCE